MKKQCWFRRWSIAIACAGGLTLALSTGGSIGSAQDQAPTQEAADDEAESATETMAREEDKPPRLEANFENPTLLMADGAPISVESPGYACPTMVDLDADGKTDLVVGQFRNGNLKFYRNIADTDQPPKFEQGQWLMTGDKRAEVPGVS